MAEKSHKAPPVSATTRRLGRGLSSLIGESVRVDAPGQTSPGLAPVAVPTGGLAAAGGAGGPGFAEHAPPGVAGVGEVGGVGGVAAAASGPGGDTSPRVERVPAADIVPSPYQPRRRFDESALASLAESIRTAGVMQPVLLRRRQITSVGAPVFELVAGERRLRAARLAGLSHVPAVVVALSDQEAAEWALIENVQREDLGVMERAAAYANLVRGFGLTHAQVAERVGVDRVTISNTMRLLELEQPVRESVEAGRLSFAQARSLLGLPAGPARVEIARAAEAGAWTVVMIEAAVAQVQAEGAASVGWRGWSAGSPWALATPRRAARQGRTPHDQPPASIDPETRITLDARAREVAEVERRLRESLGTKVRVRVASPRGHGTGSGGGAARTSGGDRRGKIVVEWYSLDQLEGLLIKMGAADR